MIMGDRERSSEIVNLKFVVYSCNEYLLNTTVQPRLGAEHTTEQDGHIFNSQGVHNLAQ